MLANAIKFKMIAKQLISNIREMANGIWSSEHSTVEAK